MSRAWLLLFTSLSGCVLGPGSPIGDDGTSGDGGSADASGGDPAVRACEPARGFMVAPEVLADPDDPCRPWVELVVGRAVRVGSASGSIWSRRTLHGTGILTTAAHVSSLCWSNIDNDAEIPEGDCPEVLWDPSEHAGEANIRLTDANGRYASQWSAHFPLYNPATPRDQAYAPSILPRHDFSVFVVDAQVFEAWGTGFGRAPGPILNEPLPLHDPAQLTTSDPTWAEAAPGTLVLIAGNPAAQHPWELNITIARVLDDDEARKAIEVLAAVDDEEGSIAYDSEAEFLLEGHAVGGMSGAGVFDAEGRQLGILVRGSAAELDVQYLRAVRMSYVTRSIEAAFEALPAADQEAIAPYLEL